MTMHDAMTTVIPAWQTVLNNIDIAVQHAQREANSVQLLAVSKTFSRAEIEPLFWAGQKAFGENYAQELAEKAVLLPGAEWHFIGPLQSNKTRLVAEYASWVHSVDRSKVLQRLAEQRPKDLPALNICLEVNVSGEISKAGVRPAGLIALVKAVLQYDNLRLRGLMCVPTATTDVSILRGQFVQLRQLFDMLNKQGYQLDTLSMGMSQDYALAIAEGATIVRVGSRIFGPRQN